MTAALVGAVVLSLLYLLRGRLGLEGPEPGQSPAVDPAPTGRIL